ncbi:DUF4129 domain-containing protein [Galbibacter mesophilus]|uniref:DUF4129 domain-containing protein n=1 Tax=Galbibacter mesophilus TaxID=379069 RepID=UPI00191DA75E|nr:DUF4129 domain-containing protein [Galbibacter mesophilus]MCM5664299.1 DUF4129 domain-containing protein [Galbibacter mesophilus]
MLKYLPLLLLCFSLHSFTLQAKTPFFQKDTLRVDRNSELTQRSFKENVKEKYTAEEYDYETDANPDNWFLRLKKWFVDLLSDLFSIGNRPEAEKLAQIISRVFYFAIILAVIYFIVKAILKKEGRWIFGKSSNKKVLNVQDIESNIYETDFKKLIEEAVQQQNFRLAIRYYYVWLLKELSEKGHIDYDVEKTNSDYLHEIKEQRLKTNFSYASYLYNYIWYGEFVIVHEEYNKAALQFENYINNLKK